MRFLFAWQHVERAHRVTGIDGLRAIVATLDGYELAASAWERSVLPARMEKYEPGMLDMLCLTGEVGWARLSKPQPAHIPAGRLVGTTPVALFLREHGWYWQAMRDTDDGAADAPLGPGAVRLRDKLEQRGASFLRELSDQDLDGASAIVAIAELVAAGLVASDGFAGLRAVVRAAGGRPPGRDQTHAAGRWSLLRTNAAADRAAAVEAQAWSYLRRYGVVFRRVLAREANAAPWRELTRVYRRLEARGEIRGGRFVSGMSGEQFALPDAVTELREIRRTPGHGQLIVVGAADPLNLAGIITTGDRVRAVASSRLAYCDGVPIAALEGDYVRPLTSTAPIPSDVATLLAGRRLPAVASGYVGGLSSH
jgi:ATP-dependent Lhr-like helicase